MLWRSPYRLETGALQHDILARDPRVWGLEFKGLGFRDLNPKPETIYPAQVALALLTCCEKPVPFFANCFRAHCSQGLGGLV
jgi:hypothetical protein